MAHNSDESVVLEVLQVPPETRHRKFSQAAAPRRPWRSVDLVGKLQHAARKNLNIWPT